jgi:hypothetical protein
VLARLLLIAVLASPAGALAQPSGARAGRQALARAEEAYLRVDFEATREAAQEALRAGGHNRRRLTRIYQLLGIAGAALEDEEASREAYIRMLAIDEGAALDRSLAPRLRQPFLEARGFWSSRSDRLAAVVTLARPRGALHIEMVDPLGMIARWAIHARIDGGDEIYEREGTMEESIYVALPGLREARRVELALEVFDELGNRVVEIGTADEPYVIERGIGGGGGGGDRGGDRDGGGDRGGDRDRDGGRGARWGDDLPACDEAAVRRVLAMFGERYGVATDGVTVTLGRELRTFVIAPGRDVRIVLSGGRTLAAWRGALHEIGHGLVGATGAWPARAVDETVATFIADHLTRAEEAAAIVGPALVSAGDIAAAARVAQERRRRAAAMTADFEATLYREPGGDLEARWHRAAADAGWDRRWVVPPAPLWNDPGAQAAYLRAERDAPRLARRLAAGTALGRAIAEADA